MGRLPFEQLDLLVIGDVDANYFTAEQRTWIKDFVAEGGGLVVIAGRLHAPATWLCTPLADVLPVEFPSVKFPLDAARRLLTFAFANDIVNRLKMESLREELESRIVR